MSAYERKSEMWTACYNWRVKNENIGDISLRKKMQPLRTYN